MSEWSPEYWRRSPTARAIAEREGVGLSHPGGTLGHPRTARKARGKTYGKNGNRPSALARAVGYDPGGRPAGSSNLDPGVRALLAGGYYDELRRAFEEADE